MKDLCKAAICIGIVGMTSSNAMAPTPQETDPLALSSNPSIYALPEACCIPIQQKSSQKRSTRHKKASYS